MSIENTVPYHPCGCDKCLDKLLRKADLPCELADNADLDDSIDAMELLELLGEGLSDMDDDFSADDFSDEVYTSDARFSDPCECGGCEVCLSDLGGEG